MTKLFEFPTEAEASAFVQGVEFVNDSAIEVISIRAVEGGYCVTVEDEDARPEDEQEGNCPRCACADLIPFPGRNFTYCPNCNHQSQP